MVAPVRHVIVFACFLATFCAYVERVGFSIAYTRMAKEAQLDEAVKGRVLSTFYWGYALSQARQSVLNANGIPMRHRVLS